MLDSKDMERILVEVSTGKKPAKPDTAEMAAFRRKLEKQVAEIEKEGYQVDVPMEWPD